MKNYYEFLSSTPMSSTEEIKKKIHKKKKEISKMKLHKDHKHKIRMELKEIEFILTDYHRRKEYDYYFYTYFFPLDLEKRKYHFSEDTTSTPYLEHFEHTTSPPFFESDPIPNSFQDIDIIDPTKTNTMSSQTSSFIQSSKDGTMVYRKKYQNFNGEEKEKEEKYFIDKFGKKRFLL